ncbi:MAG TPA: magnesium protoporphyrin IX methyltransferase [Gemmatimonas sp.]|nr:magnesium protoporphyrin IX methyltransferase [Gemmatimonas sp.]
MTEIKEQSPHPGPSFGGTPVGGSHAGSASYLERRAWIGDYFDRTASAAWKTLTSDAPVSRIRASVRAGRDETRQTLLSWLPQDMRGMRVLDAGCGTGMLAIDMALRGAQVVAVDLSPTLVGYGAERAQEAGVGALIDFRSGDMLDPAFGSFDVAVAMDSLIHYDLPHIVSALVTLRERASDRILFTVAPFTPVLGTLLTLGRFFPQRDRSPRIVPAAERRVRRSIADEPRLGGWKVARSQRVERGFYRSQSYLIHA